VARLSVREIVSSKDPALRQAYALLRKTFPPSERVPYREWVDTLEERETGMWSDTAWHLFVAEREGHVVGLASGSYIGNVNVGMVGYLAATPETRGSGIGTRLRNRLRGTFERDARRVAGRSLDAILGEVSTKNRWLARLSQNPRVLVLDIEYFQPKLYPTDDPSPFVLYYEAMETPRSSIPVAELRQILYAIWRRVYRVRRPLERPAFRRMLRTIEGKRRVGRRKTQTRRRSG